VRLRTPPPVETAGQPVETSDQRVLDGPHHACHVRVRVDAVLNLLHRVHDGRVVTAGEVLTDLRVRVRGQLADQVHGDLPRYDQFVPPALAAYVVRVHGEVLGRLSQDVDHGQVQVARREHVRERLGDGLAVQGNLVHRRVDDRAHQRPLQFADVRGDVTSDVVDDLRWHLHAAVLGVHLEDGDAGLQFGRLDVGDEAPLETATQAV